MSFGGIVQAIGGSLENQLVNVYIKPYRAVAGFQADAVIDEEGIDELVLTDHPVEQGATITDHAYKMPATVTLEYGWSAGSPQAGDDPQFLTTLYGQILDLQASRSLFTIYTGKRMYSNMLIQSLALTTNKDTENALIVRMTCREVIVVQTQVVNVGGDASTNATPEDNSPVEPQGLQQTAPAPSLNIPSIQSIIPNPGSYMAQVQSSISNAASNVQSQISSLI
jgi:hypothetical protein